MVKRALAGLESPEAAIRSRARWTLDHLELARERALPRWLKRLLSDQANTSRDFKMMRANKRGLLHFDRPRSWGYPKNWTEVASTIRRLDGYRCVACGTGDRVLDVHHIVYVSHFGTHQKPNLITLCRPCHEAEHARSLDTGETAASASSDHEGRPSTAMPGCTRESQQAATVARKQDPAKSQTDGGTRSGGQAATLPLGTMTQRPTEAGPGGVTVHPDSVNQSTTTDSQRSGRVRNPSRQPERYCGYCRNLVIPVKRLLWFRSCPRCGSSI